MGVGLAACAWTRLRAGALSVAAVLVAFTLLAGPAHADGVTALAPTPADHDAAAVTALSDGRVLVVGGTGLADQQAAELYDATTNRWTQAAAPGVPIEAAAIAPLAGDRALVVGGMTPQGADLAAARIYDAATDSWSDAAPMSVPRAGAVAAALPDGDVLVAGGASDGTNTRGLSAEIYHPATNTWTDAAPLPAATIGVAVTLSDGRVMVIGDPDQQDRSSGSEFYDPQTNGWTSGPTLPAELSAYAAVAMPGDRVAIVSSSNTPGYDADLIYDGVSNTFTVEDDLPTIGFGVFAAPLPDGNVLVGGGWTVLTTTEPDGTVTSGSAPNLAVDEWTPPAPDAQTLIDPQIDGVPRIGAVLTAEVDLASDAPAALQWQRCATTCVNVGAPVNGPVGGSSPTYTVTNADVGSRIRLVVTVQAYGQTMTAASPAGATVQAPALYLAASQGEPLSTSDGHGVIAVMASFSPAATTVSVQYTVRFPTVGREQLYPPMTGTLTYAPGQTYNEIDFPLTDAGARLLATSVQVTLSDPVGAPISGPTTIIYPFPGGRSTAAYATAPGNPLGLANAPSGSDPLSGAHFYDDPDSLAQRYAAKLISTDQTDARYLHAIALQPGVTRFGAWNGLHPGATVAAFMKRVDTQEPGSVPMISTYRIINGQCHRAAETSADAAAYHAWITSLAEGIGTHPAVLFLEMDSLITTPCLSPQGLAIRLQELRDAVAVLSNDPHLVIYLDAGAADALKPARAAWLLEQAGVAGTEGFFLNATHFDWTSKEIAYGDAISHLIGGKHFVINTAENGQGPLVPRDRAVNGNEVLCNPAGRGLGPLPTARTGVANVDAYAWIANPGVSGGPCVPGAPNTGVFWPALAISLAKHADFAVR